MPKFYRNLIRLTKFSQSENYGSVQTCSPPHRRDGQIVQFADDQKLEGVEEIKNGPFEAPTFH